MQGFLPLGGTFYERLKENGFPFALPLGQNDEMNLPEWDLKEPTATSFVNYGQIIVVLLHSNPF